MNAIPIWLSDIENDGKEPILVNSFIIYSPLTVCQGRWVRDKNIVTLISDRINNLTTLRLLIMYILSLSYGNNRRLPR